MNLPLKDRHLYGAGAAVCAVCCAAPLFALWGIGIAGTAATIATFAFAGAAFALVVATGSVLAVWSRRRGPAHSEGGDRPDSVELELSTRPRTDS